MKAIQISEFGTPWEMAKVVDVPEREPGPGEVAIAVEAAPINPSDLLMMRGFYGVRPALPAVFGTEGVGRVTTVGEGVEHLKPGDRVLVPYETAAYAERTVGPAAWLFPLPDDADVLQLAMLGVNPPTAYLMLKEYVALQPGEWVIQNAANSGVGRAVIAIAKSIGLKSVNVVRREEALQDIEAAGGDIALVDGPDLGRRVVAATGKAKIRLGLEAVGGAATSSLMSALAPGATVVNYARLSAQPAHAPQPNIIFRDQSIRGFWLAPWFRRTKPERIASMYRELLPLLTSGAIRAPVERTFGLDGAAEALSLAARAKAKVLFMPRAA